MGSPDGKGEAPEHPAHEVMIQKPFYMSISEITQAQWKALAGTNPSKFKGDALPVEFVSWEDAHAFAEQVTRTESNNVAFRLPSEAEWEYACRAGSTAAFCSGDDPAGLAGHAWFDVNAGGMTRPVMTRKPNAWGLFDMHGNVWEWCEDAWHETYAGAPADGSPWTGGGQGGRRVVRGGSWAFGSTEAGSAFRMGLEASARMGDSLGFRLVAVPK